MSFTFINPQIFFIIIAGEIFVQSTSLRSCLLFKKLFLAQAYSVKTSARRQDPAFRAEEISLLDLVILWIP